MRDYLWEGSEEGKKDHLISLEVVSLPNNKVGLTIGNILPKIAILCMGLYEPAIHFCIINTDHRMNCFLGTIVARSRKIFGIAQSYQQRFSIESDSLFHFFISNKYRVSTNGLDFQLVSVGIPDSHGNPYLIELINFQGLFISNDEIGRVFDFRSMFGQWQSLSVVCFLFYQCLHFFYGFTSFESIF